MTTPIILRAFDNGDKIALFPNQPATVNGNDIVCFDTISSHGSADYSYIMYKTRSAGLSECAELLKALENAGYDDLKLYTKQTAKHRDEIAEELAKFK